MTEPENPFPVEQRAEVRRLAAEHDAFPAGSSEQAAVREKLIAALPDLDAVDAWLDRIRADGV